jgi:hypothetical protein
MVSTLLKLASQSSKHRWIEGSLIAAFAVAAASAWSWRLPFLNMSMTSSADIKLETPSTIPIFENNPTNLKTHLIILVHGWMGNALEMNYLRQALIKEWEPHSSSGRLVIHAATSNEGLTSDGIEAGGNRLAAEVNQLLHGFRQQSGRSSMLYLSMVGNSLGGLYARYALSLVDWNLVDQPLTFVTTATPHLGVSYPHTYVPLNRGLEWVVANTLQQTGRDLFLRSNVVEQLGTDPKYLTPLQRFHRRIAYANSFGTDFQVPTATAGFLSPTSASPHTIKSSSSTQYDESYVVLTADTHPTNKSISSLTEKNDMQTLVENLDALGWTKVFCDVRESLPAVPLPFRGKDLREPFPSSKVTAGTEDRVTTSKELHDLVTKPIGSKWHFPAGHTVLVANSKNEFSANLNKWGRPIMDRLARDILEDFVNSDKV